MRGDMMPQDCLTVEVLRDRDAPPVVFFGVFDGHGEHGGTVAALAAEQLPQFVDEQHPQDGEPALALMSGFSSIQQFLLQQPGLDCSLSGCTAVVALLVEDTLVVANAGDSRCLAGRFEGGAEVVAYELTNDHTPALLHEANRILASGGRIAPLQFGGTAVGPPRVWERGADQPGLCITRSLGDTHAKRLGVSHAPEVSTFELTAGDRYLALVSDGITEFMSSQEIIDKIHKWASAGTMPHEVARRLVREARSRWKEFGDEGIVDDCTAVVGYLVYDQEEEEEQMEGEKDSKDSKKKRMKQKKKTKAAAAAAAARRLQGGGAGASGSGGGGDDGDVAGGAAASSMVREQERTLGQQVSALWTTMRRALSGKKKEKEAAKRKEGEDKV
ncbi:hypothetical protein PLESTF_000072400 [Pleodorina starrii]|nr:hypothetical protein PLESTF_000072400 [Pleodorina starrii]